MSYYPKAESKVDSNERQGLVVILASVLQPKSAMEMNKLIIWPEGDIRNYKH